MAVTKVCRMVYSPNPMMVKACILRYQNFVVGKYLSFCYIVGVDGGVGNVGTCGGWWWWLVVVMTGGAGGIRTCAMYTCRHLVWYSEPVSKKRGAMAAIV